MAARNFLRLVGAGGSVSRQINQKRNPPMPRATLAFVLSASLAFAQTGTQVQKSATTQTSASTPQSPKHALAGFGLEDGTSVRMKLTRNLSSADEHKGDQVDFETLDDVLVDNVLVIPKGSIAKATITEAEHKKSMGRGGKLNVNIDSVKLKDGEHVALRAIKEGKGGGHVGAMTGAIVATSIVFFPAAPLFLFVHGKDMNIPKGTEVVAYVDGDTLLDRSKFDEKLATAAAPAPSVQNATVNIVSTPAGADIEVDGSFAGNAPSALSLSVGEHTIRITKNGFQAWERKLKLSGGTVNVTAELEAAK